MPSRPRNITRRIDPARPLNANERRWLHTGEPFMPDFHLSRLQLQALWRQHGAALVARYGHCWAADEFGMPEEATDAN